MLRRSFALLLLAASPALAQTGGGEPNRPTRREPPFDQIAQDLGIPADRVREAFRKVGPPTKTDQPPTEAQRKAHAEALAAAMNVSPDKLMAVLEKYRPGPPSGQGAGSRTKS
jgi:hypothetical protein